MPPYRAPGRIHGAGNCALLQNAAPQHKVRMSARARGHYPGSRLPEGALSGLKTAGYWDATREQDWGLPEHRDEGIEVTFVESGLLGFIADGMEYRLKPDDLTVTRPWEWHGVGAPTVATGRLHWVIFDVGASRPEDPWNWPAWVSLTQADRDELAAALSARESPVLHASSEIRRIFRSLANAVHIERDARCVSHLAVWLNELLLELLESSRSPTPAGNAVPDSVQAVGRFLTGLYTGTEPAGREWKVEEMARACGLGPTQFGRHVRRLTNLTPAQYLNECRLGMAVGLLQSTGLNITDVALTCGFSSSQYFATVFRRRYGCTPRDFRLTPLTPAAAASPSR